MKTKLPLPQDKKLTIVFRVEPGCLGPDGGEHVEEFCNSAKIDFEYADSDYIYWEIIPRHDKSLPEMQFKVGNKILTHEKAVKYLGMFDKNLDELEEYFHENIAILIGNYMRP